VLSLIDTNVLVYRFDGRFPEKQAIATELLRRGIADDSVRIPHQAILEFVTATTRPRGCPEPLLTLTDAYREAEEMLTQFEIVYPSEAVIRMAIRGAATYQLNWFDANIWAYAEQYGFDEILSEDFEHGRLYGSVKATDPFRLVLTPINRCG
jgi:predicted nucleic acid-binding protein